MLEKRWEETEWTRSRAEVALRRIDGVLELLPVWEFHEGLLSRKQPEIRAHGPKLGQLGLDSVDLARVSRGS